MDGSFWKVCSGKRRRLEEQNFSTWQQVLKMVTSHINLHTNLRGKILLIATNHLVISTPCSAILFSLVVVDNVLPIFKSFLDAAIDVIGNLISLTASAAPWIQDRKATLSAHGGRAKFKKGLMLFGRIYWPRTRPKQLGKRQILNGVIIIRTARDFLQSTSSKTVLCKL